MHAEGTPDSLEIGFVERLHAVKETEVIGFLSTLALCLAPPVQSESPPDLAPEQFRAWFDAARRGKLEIPEEVRRNARRFRYVFICGLFNDQMSGYFAQNVQELRARGVPQQSIHLVRPDSRRTVAGNCESVRSELQTIATRGPEQLVLIGHSRGACDALAFALRNPEFVKQHIRALFLIQGPFGGTAVADFVAGEGQSIDRRMPAGYRLMGRVIGGLEPQVLEDDTHQAIASLNRKDSESFWKEAILTHSAAIPVVGPKTFYVTSRTKPSHHPIFQRVTGWYLGTYYGPNDGLVTLEDQSLQGLGTVLAVLDVGHTDLTRRFPAARPRHRLRSALVDAIIMAVGEAA
jgi:pimeloyl-ACP methyl ester carboxylesterase